MKWFLAVAVLLAGAAVRGEQYPTTLVGRVVAVPDGSSLWIYVEEARASYHFRLAGIKPVPADQPLGKAARDTLARLVLGRQVEVKVQRLREEGEIPAQVFSDHRSINWHLACLLPVGAGSGRAAPPPGLQPWKPLPGLCSAFRLLAFCRERILRIL